MNQLNNLQPAWAYIAFGVLFCISIIWIFKGKKTIEFEAPLPGESEVVGKDLPVGFQFMKDGKVVEVVNNSGCDGCLYDNPERMWDDKCADHPLCCAFERVKGDSIVFKYIDNE